MSAGSMTVPTRDTLNIRVYYEDTDAGKVVYYANYLKFFERARTEWLRRLGVSQSALATEHQQLFVVRKLEIQYRKPAFLDDLLTIDSQIQGLGRASLVFYQRASRHEELLCDGIVHICCVNADSLRPTPLSDELRTLLDKARN